jgi:hypothetical protein
MSISDAVQQHLGPTEIDQISQQLGVSPDVAQRAVSAALPMILGGMASHAARPEGAATVGQAINTHQDATDNVASLLAAGPPADAPSTGGLLGRIFGTHHDTVTTGVQQASGLDADRTKRLLLMLSPILLGILARRQFGNQPATSAGGQLGNVLQQEAQSAARQSPQVGGLLGSLFNNLSGGRPDA